MNPNRWIKNGMSRTKFCRFLIVRQVTHRFVRKLIELIVNILRCVSRRVCVKVIGKGARGLLSSK